MFRLTTVWGCRLSGYLAWRNLGRPEDKRYAPMGLAQVGMDKCVLSTGEQDCSLCQTTCPYTAIEITFDEETYESTVTIHPELCVGCGACPPDCPANPTTALTIVPHESARS